MPARVRPARRDDEAVPELLYVSAQPYYDAFAGSGMRARRMLTGVYPRPRHTASFDICRVVESAGRVVGATASFPSAEGDRLARRFLALTLTRMPAWRWPGVLRHLRASALVTPVPPEGALYVDALAVDTGFRRRRVAWTLLEDAEAQAAAAGLAGIALDTGLHNTAAQALYEAYGFERRDVREAPDERTARAIGGPGFVSYFRSG